MGNKLNGPHPHPREPVKQILTQPDNGILYSCKKEGGPSSCADTEGIPRHWQGKTNQDIEQYIQRLPVHVKMRKKNMYVYIY